jgi:purine-nucleoside phosphorylase
MKSDLKDKVKEASEYIKKEVDLVPQIGIILGTGLGSLGDGIEVTNKVEYGDIPHFPVSTVESHQGRLLFGYLKDKPVVAMQGRFHYYEGYTLQQVTFPVRVMKELGIEILIVSNACGGLNPQFNKKDIMIITDHINLLGNNPLIGPNDETIGPRFPDMYDCYDRELVTLAEQVAIKLHIPVQKGVYVAVAGPNLETAAEYRFLRTIGADVVGMSTVPEVIAARHQGTRVMAFSIITDMGLPDALEPCSLEDVISAASAAEPVLRDLISGCVEKIDL